MYWKNQTDNVLKIFKFLSKVSRWRHFASFFNVEFVFRILLLNTHYLGLRIKYADKYIFMNIISLGSSSTQLPPRMFAFVAF